MKIFENYERGKNISIERSLKQNVNNQLLIGNYETPLQEQNKNLYEETFLQEFKPSLIEKLGITIFEKTDKRYNIIFENKFNVQSVEEGSSFDNEITTLLTKLETGRTTYILKKKFEQNYLALPNIEKWILAEADQALKMMAVKDIFKQIESLNNITDPTLDKLVLSLNTENLLNSVALIMPKATFLSTTGIEGIDHLEGKLLKSGTKVIGSDSVSKPIIADFSKALITFYGDLNIVINPYTYSNTGEIEVSFIRIADARINPYMCASF